MRSTFIVAAALGLGGCVAGPGPDRTSALMDEVEKNVRLPEGAAPLTAYTRYYAYGGRGKVEARYRIALDPPWPCPKDKDDTILAGLPCEPLKRSRAPRRHWVAVLPDPGVHDGGCAVIHISYDLATRRVERISCNGTA